MIKFFKKLLHRHKWVANQDRQDMVRNWTVYGVYKCKCGKTMVTKEYPDGYTFKKILD